MTEFQKPPEIPADVWEEFEKLRLIQERLTAAALDIIPFPIRIRGDRTAKGIDALIESREQERKK